jgi:tetratricopeptide (TPR) repeat protein
MSHASPRDADAWNELAHAYRKSGDLDNAFKGYEKALRIDPKHRNAHEYLGEAYLQAGDLARAEAQLRNLDKLCFLPCEQYADLKEGNTPLQGGPSGREPVTGTWSTTRTSHSGEDKRGR